MNPAKCKDLDYIHFLTASVDIFTCTEAAKYNPSEQIILHMMHLPVFCKTAPEPPGLQHPSPSCFRPASSDASGHDYLDYV